MKDDDFEFYWETPKKKSVNNRMSIEKGNRFGKSSVNISESENSVNVKVFIPGFRRKDIEIRVSDQILEIKASNQIKENQRTGKSFIHEFSTNSFRKIINLPCRVDTKSAKAMFEDNILEVKLRKLF